MRSCNVIAPCLRPEEQLDALHEFYDVIRAGLGAYEETVARSRRMAFELSTN